MRKFKWLHSRTNFSIFRQFPYHALFVHSCDLLDALSEWFDYTALGQLKKLVSFWTFKFIFITKPTSNLWKYIYFWMLFQTFRIFLFIFEYFFALWPNAIVACKNYTRAMISVSSFESWRKMADKRRRRPRHSESEYSETDEKCDRNPQLKLYNKRSNVSFCFRLISVTNANAMCSW